MFLSPFKLGSWDKQYKINNIILIFQHIYKKVTNFDFEIFVCPFNRENPELLDQQAHRWVLGTPVTSPPRKLAHNLPTYGEWPSQNPYWRVRIALASPLWREVTGQQCSALLFYIHLKGASVRFFFQKKKTVY